MNMSHTTVSQCLKMIDETMPPIDTAKPNVLRFTAVMKDETGNFAWENRRLQLNKRCFLDEC